MIKKKNLDSFHGIRIIHFKLQELGEEDDDDDFNDLYKEYTGPPVLKKTSRERPVASKRLLSSSDEEEEEKDPNAVPTDFTSRDKKAWDAKSKATERNWKKRKEEEMICKLCGDSGHYTQGCPSTLGVNGIEHFQRVAARDKHVRALLTGKVMADIEKEIGCKLRLDEKFLFVSGKDRLILGKGVDAVHKLINGDGRRYEARSVVAQFTSPNSNPSEFRYGPFEFQKSSSSPRNRSQFEPKYNKQENATKDHAREHPEKEFHYHKTSRSKSPDRSSSDLRFARTDSRKSNSNVTQVQPRYNQHVKAMEDSVREDLQRMSKDSPKAYGCNGARCSSIHSKSPSGHVHSGNSFTMYDSHNQDIEGKTSVRDTGRLRSVIKPRTKVENPEFPQSLEELELEFKREATDLSDVCDKEEDEENLRHRETIRGIRESYIKKLSPLRTAHTKQWDEFLQLDTQRRKKQLDAQRKSQSKRLDLRHPASGYGSVDTQQALGKYSNDVTSPANHHYTGSSYPMNANLRYPDPSDDYVPSTSRMNDGNGEYHSRRLDDFGRNYNRY